MAAAMRDGLPFGSPPVTRRRFLGSMLLAAGAAAALACGTSTKRSNSDATPTSSSTPPPASGFYDSSGVRIHYEVTGSGRPLVLLHGWANNYKMNFVDLGWIDTLSPIRRIIGVDQRGHGASDKPHDPAAYSNEIMTNDVIGLLDYLGIEKADFFGYSMGAQVTTRLLAQAPERVSAAVLGGVGVGMLNPAGDDSQRIYAAVISALEADDPSTIENDVLRTVRNLYESQGNDLKALAAWLEADHFAATREQLANVSVPVLVVNGEADPEGPQVAAAIAGAQIEVIPGTNHITVMGDQRFKDRVYRFLNELDG
jgi:pimeloyl-ACP methyl ester carboxylesterase